MTTHKLLTVANLGSDFTVDKQQSKVKVNIKAGKGVNVKHDQHGITISSQVATPPPLHYLVNG